MQGRAFLDVARILVRGTSEAFWRATVIHSYYAMFLECRDALARWGIAIPLRQNVHATVRLRFTYAADADLKKISFTLDHWCKWRNKASYNLASVPGFATDVRAQNAIAEIAAALAVLDAIEADPVRRAAAIAAFPP